MQSLRDFDSDKTIGADVVIVGGGACGMTLARALTGSGMRILLLESGGPHEDLVHEELNRVEADVWSEDADRLRDSYHRNLTTLWSGERQPFGVRCRGLGGSTQAWAGKSRALDPIDYRARPWVPSSGWPVSEDTLVPLSLIHI